MFSTGNQETQSLPDNTSSNKNQEDISNGDDKSNLIQAIPNNEDPMVAKSSNMEAMNGNQVDKIKEVRDSITCWQNNSKIFLDNLMHWQHNNMTAFLTTTWVNPSISTNIERNGWINEGHRWISTTLGDTCSYYVNQLIKKKMASRALGVGAGALTGLLGLGAASGPPGWLVIGASVLVEISVAWLYEAFTGDAMEELITTAGDAHKDLIQSLNNRIFPAFDKAELDILKKAERYRDIVNNSDCSISELNQMINDLNKECEKLQSISIDVNDESLFLMMLEQWVLEHAGEEDNADDDTDEGQWEKAIDLVKENNPSFDKGEDLNGHVEIFVHQFRAELNRWGLRTDEADKLQKKLTNLLINNPANRVQSILGMFDDDKNREHFSEFNFEDIISNDRFISRFQDTTGLLYIPSNVKEQILQGDFQLKIYLNLDDDNEAIFVDDFLYYLKVFDLNLWDKINVVNDFTGATIWSSSPD